jgi:hypothetical protein
MVEHQNSCLTGMQKARTNKAKNSSLYLAFTDLKIEAKIRGKRLKQNSAFLKFEFDLSLASQEGYSRFSKDGGNGALG